MFTLYKKDYIIKSKDLRGKLLLSVENPYAVRPKLINDMPVATERGHGLGTKSIRQSAESLGGKCQYSVSDTMFIVRVII